MATEALDLVLNNLSFFKSFLHAEKPGHERGYFGDIC